MELTDIDEKLVPCHRLGKSIKASSALTFTNHEQKKKKKNSWRHGKIPESAQISRWVPCNSPIKVADCACLSLKEAKKSLKEKNRAMEVGLSILSLLKCPNEGFTGKSSKILPENLSCSEC